MKTENRKTNEPHKFASNLLQILDLRMQQRPIFTNVIYCSILLLWVGYFIHFKFTSVFFHLMFLMDVLVHLKKEIDKAVCVLLFDVFNGCSSSVKEINR